MYFLAPWSPSAFRLVQASSLFLWSQLSYWNLTEYGVSVILNWLYSFLDKHTHNYINIYVARAFHLIDCCCGTVGYCLPQGKSWDVKGCCWSSPQDSGPSITTASKSCWCLPSTHKPQQHGAPELLQDLY